MHTIVYLRQDGYIQTRESFIVHNAVLPEHTPIKYYSSIKKAKEALPPDPDAVIVHVTHKRINTMYFSARQMQQGFYHRLNIFQGCYGTIKVRERH